MLTAKSFAQFKKVISKNKTFIISGHVGPDGDVIGSILALTLGLKQLGKKAYAYNRDGCPNYLKFLPKSDLFIKEIPKKTEEMVLITVDSGDLGRLGADIGNSKFKLICNIDHHQSNTRFGDFNFIDVKAGSTGQVVISLLEKLPKFKISKDIAQCVLCTLSTDTGSFRYSNATTEVFGLASKLVSKGARPEVISEALYETYPKRRLLLMRKVLDTLRFEYNDQLATMTLTKDILNSVEGNSEDSEEFVNLPRGVVGVKVVLFIKEKSQNEWKLSFRSRGNIDVLKIATEFGGGGHKLAAGCTAHGSLDEVMSKVRDKLEALEYFK